MPDKRSDPDIYHDPFEQPTEDQLERYLKEMGTDREKVIAEVEELKSWLASHPVLPTLKDETFLERFHAHCKFDIEKTKRKLDAYYRTRASEPGIMLNRDPLDPLIKQAKDNVAHFTLPQLTPEGYRVTFIRAFNTNPDFFSPEQSLKASLMMLDCHINQDLCISHVLVFDFKGFTPHHLLKLTPNYLKKSERCFTRAFPHRYAQIHLLNVKPFMNATINLYKLVMGKKLASRFMAHTDLDSFHQFVPKHILPVEYGGTYQMNAEEIRDLSYDMIVRKRDWFLTEKDIYADITRDPDGFNDIFGTKGTFRKIQID